jgi:hypothetical protein
MTASNGRLTQPTFVGHSHDLALRADRNNPLAHSPCHKPQIAAGLLQSGELKFDKPDRAVSLYNRGATRQPTTTATPAGFRRQIPTSGPLLAKTDNTFEKPRRDGGIRTRGLLLPNQRHPDAGRGSTSSNVAFAWDNDRLRSPGVARQRCTLAPTLAPQSGSGAGKQRTGRTGSRRPAGQR